ncbi:RNA 2',3'-cyclic phosphodiesterase [Haloglomus irregulare]|jgi:2'-5' RNA ligase|uniref:RNA 2',3'-cyclic phosphodiesterase n=1 Tax=Haloglomus irregulare TaxID=2234134 RepID=A0A554NCD7_9EURY|nr:RNA 2',3'-cyclic phosphodiesterase [Haloglomus irregulare]TSD15057.1 RNA 2',3'-cyclic phosphodiesterase [Haloglomus irregulare]
MRLFVSADLDPLAAAVRAVQAPFRDRPGLDPTDPEGVHVTLQFLGETDPARLDDVRSALAAAVDDAGVGPFTAEIGGYGVFPSLDDISVVWLGVRRGQAELTALHESVEARTTDLGFDPEDHAFTPHATVARMRDARPKTHVQEVVREREPDVGGIDIDEIRLTESTLTDTGPEYGTVARFPL